VLPLKSQLRWVGKGHSSTISFAVRLAPPVLQLHGPAVCARSGIVAQQEAIDRLRPFPSLINSSMRNSLLSLQKGHARTSTNRL
jgi:hypothetical protein